MISANDIMALGAMEAMDEAGRSVPIVGMNAMPDAVKAILAGRMLATVSYDALSLVGMAGAGRGADTGRQAGAGRGRNAGGNHRRQQRTAPPGTSVRTAPAAGLGYGHGGVAGGGGPA
ncbi:MAG: hypothetical protein H6891_01410 [Brucellaceae bacterium]|nr:hypothetical protein [Brucellaceae bacterium]